MDAEKFGTFVQTRRKELGLSQVELAEKLHVTAKAVSRWERGVGFPDIKLLEPLADALEITIVELMHSRKIEANLPKETAATMVSETVNTIQEQQKLSRKKKVMLILGFLLIGSAASFLYCLGMFYDFELRWIGSMIRLIAVVGGVWTYRAFHSIITESYLQKKDEDSIWYTWKPWTAIGVSAVGGILLMWLANYVPRDSAVFDVVVIVGFAVLLPGTIYIWKWIFNEKN